MKLSEELSARGFVYQFSAETLGEILDGPNRTAYLGVDPTADAMHVGHLVPFMLLNHLLRAGHSVVLLVGGGTALIGDPSGKDSERPFVEQEEIERQAQGLEEHIRALSVSPEIRFVNNHEWLSKLSLIEFLRDVGKHFTVNAMMKKDSVSARLASEQGISFTEFTYALLQSYDYYHLNETYGCDLQIGASDQWGNIISGIDFIRRKNGREVFGLTMPLIVNPATGKKFGKSEGNAVWLDPKKTSPYQFYQFWLNTSDEAALAYLKLFTFLPLDEIDAVKAAAADDPAARIAQKRLADEVTTFVHGASVAAIVQKVSAILFSGTALAALTHDERTVLKENAPTLSVRDGDALVDVLVSAGLASSKREARTFIEEGAVAVGEEKVTDSNALVETAQFEDGLVLVRRGKKQVCILELA